MKDMIIEWIVDIVLRNLEPHVIRELARKLQCVMAPIVREHKDEIFARLHAKALETDTVIDDAVYQALDAFIDQLLPETCEA
jgi:hypothetical protein